MTNDCLVQEAAWLRNSLAALKILHIQLANNTCPPQHKNRKDTCFHVIRMTRIVRCLSD